LRSKYWDRVHRWRHFLNQNQTTVEDCLISANNLGDFYRYVTRRISDNSGIGVRVDSNKIITDNMSKASAFNCYFASVRTTGNNVTPDCGSVALSSSLDNTVITVGEVTSSIDKLKSSCSNGPDRLSPIFFKRLKHCLSVPLALLYNQLMSVCYVPSEWLAAPLILYACTKMA